MIRIEMKMTRANVTLLLFSSSAQEKLSAELNGASDCPCSRASPGNKSGIKRIFSIATKMASKAADRDKKTWKEPPPHLQAWPDICLDSLIHSLAPIVNATADASHPLLFLFFSFIFSSKLSPLDKRTNIWVFSQSWCNLCLLVLSWENQGGICGSRRNSTLGYFDKIVIAWHLMSRSNVGNPFQIFAISQQWQIMMEDNIIWRTSWISLCSHIMYYVIRVWAHEDKSISWQLWR